MDELQKLIEDGEYITKFANNDITFYNFCNDLKEIENENLTNHDLCNRVCKYIINILSKISDWKRWGYKSRHDLNIYDKSLVCYIFDNIKQSLSNVDNFNFDIACIQNNAVYLNFKVNEVDKYYIYYITDEYTVNRLKSINKNDFDAIKAQMGNLIKFTNKAVS